MRWSFFLSRAVFFLARWIFFPVRFGADGFFSRPSGFSGGGFPGREGFPGQGTHEWFIGVYAKNRQFFIFRMQIILNTNFEFRSFSGWLRGFDDFFLDRCVFFPAKTMDVLRSPKKYTGNNVWYECKYVRIDDRDVPLRVAQTLELADHFCSNY